MHDFIVNWAILVGVFTIALASPGPDFVIAVRNSIQQSRRIGIITAFGFAAGVSVHVTYCLMGLATVIAQSIILFNILKFIGAGYLFYVGISALRSQGFSMDESPDMATAPRMTALQAFRSGFITNLFNPKATLFFMALFTQILSPQIPVWTSVVYGITCVAVTALWFTIVATVLTTPVVRAQFLKCSKWIDRVCGGVLIALGIRLALTKAAHS